jgi:hypothetical protein
MVGKGMRGWGQRQQYFLQMQLRQGVKGCWIKECSSSIKFRFQQQQQ